MKKKPIHKSSKPIVAAKVGGAARVTAAAPKKINVSQGVIAGNKLGGMTPQYPAISKGKRLSKGNVIAKAKKKA